jgi:ppGpp synthetase/RelA/SpoT-type nucleotidyltranferase
VDDLVGCRLVVDTLAQARSLVQVRTRRQHAWAEMVEAHDRVTHDDAKRGRAPGHVIAGLFAMSEILFTIDQQHLEEDT